MTYSDSSPNPPAALLAEDEEAIRELVALYLERMGYRALTACNGKEALDILAKTKDENLQLIVTDMEMPKAKGSELAQEAKNQGICQRILIMSGYTDETGFVSEAIEEGTEFLKKPFTFAEFEAKVVALQQRFAHP